MMYVSIQRLWVCIVVVSMGWIGTAQGYVLYTSPDNPEAYLRWFDREMVYVIDIEEPEEMTAEVADDQILESFNTWSTLSCGETSVPFDLLFGGHVEGKTVGHNNEDLEDNENLVIWIKEPTAWFYDNDVLALTSLTYDTQNGQIVDVDMEINDAFFTFSATGEAGKIDLRNAIVHETGHLLGLDHSLDTQSTMFAKALPGETKKQTLEQDDIDGFCALYGPNALPIPPKGVNVQKRSGCALNPRVPTLGALWILMLGFGALLIRRGRRAMSTHR